MCIRRGDPALQRKQKKNGGVSESERSAEKERGTVGALDIVVLDSVGV